MRNTVNCRWLIFYKVTQKKVSVTRGEKRNNNYDVARKPVLFRNITNS